jgi:hypothetical protein
MSRPGQFQPGQSGNPKGRPPGRSQVLDWYRHFQWTAFCVHARNAVQRENLSVSESAAQYITDRTMGRPKQAIEATVADLNTQHFLAVAALNGVPVTIDAQSDPEGEGGPFEAPDDASTDPLGVGDTLPLWGDVPLPVMHPPPAWLDQLSPNEIEDPSPPQPRDPEQPGPNEPFGRGDPPPPIGEPPDDRR